MGNGGHMQLDIIRKVQEMQFNILLEVDRICRKHNIDYQLFAGSLLGAIRHGGFIPWDDDIDIVMKREDYEKLYVVAKSELGEDYFLQDPYTQKDTYHVFTKVRKNNTLFIEKGTKKSRMHQGIFIDVFPMDNVPESKKKQKKQIKRLSFLFLLRIIKTRELVLENNSFAKKILKILAFIIIFPFTIFTPLNKIILKINAESSKYNKDSTEFLTLMALGLKYNKYYKFIYSQDDYHETIDVEFNGSYFKAPKNYDQILRRMYGEYMTLPPIEQRIGSHGVIISFDNIIFYKLVSNEYKKKD